MSLPLPPFMTRTNCVIFYGALLSAFSLKMVHNNNNNKYSIFAMNKGDKAGLGFEVAHEFRASFTGPEDSTHCSKQTLHVPLLKRLKNILD